MTILPALAVSRRLAINAEIAKAREGIKSNDRAGAYLTVTRQNESCLVKEAKAGGENRSRVNAEVVLR